MTDKFEGIEIDRFRLRAARLDLNRKLNLLHPDVIGFMDQDDLDDWAQRAGLEAGASIAEINTAIVENQRMQLAGLLQLPEDSTMEEIRALVTEKSDALAA